MARELRALAFVVVLAACGGGSADDGSPASRPGTEPAETTAPATTVPGVTSAVELVELVGCSGFVDDGTETEAASISSGECALDGATLELALYGSNDDLRNDLAATRPIGCAFAEVLLWVEGPTWWVGGDRSDVLEEVATRTGGRLERFEC